ncbi:MAG: hypothetical protein WC326_12670 [Candidatus Delongbacteria bacterium]
MNAEAPQEEARRRAASLWYERFERRRQQLTPSPGRLRALQLLFLGLAVAIAVIGLSQRGERLQQVMGAAESRTDWPAVLSRELELDEAAGQRFFPLWEQWRRQEARQGAERAALLEKLEPLTREHSDLNLEQERLLEAVQLLEQQRLQARADLLGKVREQLGLWRSARLAVLLETPPD